MSRFRWLLPAALTIVWLIIGGVAGPYAGKLAEVQINDRAAFLPDEAESTRVAAALSEVQDDESLSAIVVIEYERELNDADLAEVQELAAAAWRHQRCHGVSRPTYAERGRPSDSGGRAR